jgi:hypothetical protein
MEVTLWIGLTLSNKHGSAETLTTVNKLVYINISSNNVYVKPLTHSNRPMKVWPFNCHIGMGLHGFKSS